MKRFASWLAVLCLWTAVAAVWPCCAVAEAPSGLEATQQLSTPQDEVPTESASNGGSSLPDSTFQAGGLGIEGTASEGFQGNGGSVLPNDTASAGNVDTEEVQPKGIRAWWQRHGRTLAKGLAAGAIGAGLVVLGALVVGASAPVILVGAGFAVLGGAIYGASLKGP